MRHLGVPAHQRNAQCRRRRRGVCAKDASHQRGRGLALGQQHRVEHPQRARAAGGHVVGVDIDGIPADLVGGKGDGVGLDDHVAVAHVDDGHILAHARPGDQARPAPV